jgi:hypothetical protein
MLTFEEYSEEYNLNEITRLSSTPEHLKGMPKGWKGLKDDNLKSFDPETGGLITKNSNRKWSIGFLNPKLPDIISDIPSQEEAIKIFKEKMKSIKPPKQKVEPLPKRKPLNSKKK